MIPNSGDDGKRKKLPEKRLVQHGAVEVEEWVIPWRRMCANEANGC